MARQTAWIGSVVNFQSLSTPDEVTIADEASLEQFTNPTIVRMRGKLIWKLNASTGNIYEARSFRAGLLVANKSVVAAGIDVDELELPWLWYTSGIVWAPITAGQYWNGSAAVAYNLQAGAATRRMVDTIDVAAMRRINRNDTLSLFVEHTIEAGSPSDLEVYGHIRVLVKE